MLISEIRISILKYCKKGNVFLQIYKKIRHLLVIFLKLKFDNQMTFQNVFCEKETITFAHN